MKRFNSKHLLISYDEQYENILKKIHQELEKRYELIKKTFKINDEIKIVMNILEGEKYSIDNYNIYVPKDIDKNYNNYLNLISKRIISDLLDYQYINIPNWLKVGIIEYYSMENYEIITNKIQFKYFYFDKVKRRDRVVPTLSKIIEEKNPIYSFLMFKYLLDNNYDLIKLLNNPKQIKELEKNILKKTIKYYDEQTKVSTVISEFSYLKTPEELMDYMNLYILFGWIDKDNKEHLNTMKDVRTLYKTQSLEEVLKSKIGICTEQALIISEFMKKENIEHKIFCCREYENKKMDNEKIFMHCMILFKQNNTWYNFEHSNEKLRGIHAYKNYEDAIKGIYKRYINTTRMLTEIPTIPEHKNFLEFNLYVNEFPNVNIPDNK